MSTPPPPPSPAHKKNNVNLHTAASPGAHGVSPPPLAIYLVLGHEGPQTSPLLPSPATLSTVMENREFLLPVSKLSEARIIRWESLPARMTHTPESASKDRTVVLERKKEKTTATRVNTNYFLPRGDTSYKYFHGGQQKNRDSLCGRGTMLVWGTCLLPGTQKWHTWYVC